MIPPGRMLERNKEHKETRTNAYRITHFEHDAHDQTKVTQLSPRTCMPLSDYYLSHTLRNTWILRAQ